MQAGTNIPTDRCAGRGGGVVDRGFKVSGWLLTAVQVETALGGVCTGEVSTANSMSVEFQSYALREL